VSQKSAALNYHPLTLSLSQTFKTWMTFVDSFWDIFFLRKTWSVSQASRRLPIAYRQFPLLKRLILSLTYTQHYSLLLPSTSFFNTAPWQKNYLLISFIGFSSIILSCNNAEQDRTSDAGPAADSAFRNFETRFLDSYWHQYPSQFRFDGLRKILWRFGDTR